MAACRPAPVDRHEQPVASTFAIVPSYTTVDARFGWHVSRELKLSLALQDLFDRRHPDWGAPLTRAEIRRGAFFKVLWRPQ